VQDEQGLFDVAIVCGGFAGLAAALTLGRAQRAVLVVDKGEPRNAPPIPTVTFHAIERRHSRFSAAKK